MRVFDLFTGGRTVSPPLRQHVEMAADSGRSVFMNNTKSLTPDPWQSTAVSDLQTTNLEWLWLDRVPFGMTTILEGDPGLGKTTVALKLAAALSKGTPLPGNSRPIPPSNSIFVTYEDSASDVLKPRLEALGADMARVRTIQFPGALGDCSKLRREVETFEAKLVVIDPLSAAVGGVDWHKDTEMRQVLTPLTKIADDNRAAVMVIRHLVKGQRDRQIERGSGSVAIYAAGRAVLRIEADRGTPGDSFIFSLKNNLGPAPRAVRVRRNGLGLTLLGECDVSIGDLDAAGAAKERETAKRLTLVLLAKGERLETGRFNEIMLAAGVSKRTVERVRQAIGVKWKRENDSTILYLGDSASVASDADELADTASVDDDLADAA